MDHVSYVMLRKTFALLFSSTLVSFGKVAPPLPTELGTTISLRLRSHRSR